MNNITAANAILEMIRRNMKLADVADKNGMTYMVDQYEHAVHELAVAYSISESENPDYPLTVGQVIERAQEAQDLFPI